VIGMLGSMRVRPCADGDLERIGWVHARSRQAAYDGLVPADALGQVTPETQVEVWRERLSSATTTAFVAEQDGLVVGFVSLQQTEQGTELNAIHLLPETVGTGVGSALMATAVEHARGAGAVGLHLFVIAHNERARSFYERNGWRIIGPAGTHEVGGAQVEVVRYELVL
jgi:ribosomal protein S18 acetylase RimI-like enzyme